MENKKKYQSTKDYSEKYNKLNINIQLNRSLIIELRKKLKNISLKDYLEDLIKENLK